MTNEDEMHTLHRYVSVQENHIDISRQHCNCHGNMIPRKASTDEIVEFQGLLILNTSSR